MSKSRTPSYVMTIDPNSTSDWAQVQAIRSGLRSINYNALMSNSDKRFRVTLQGRLGKNNPNYVKKYKGVYAYRVALEDAQRVDVYVHER